jgi:hypothetical protein
MDKDNAGRLQGIRPLRRRERMEEDHVIPAQPGTVAAWVSVWPPEDDEDRRPATVKFRILPVIAWRVGLDSVGGDVVTPVFSERVDPDVRVFLNCGDGKWRDGFLLGGLDNPEAAAAYTLDVAQASWDACYGVTEAA